MTVKHELEEDTAESSAKRIKTQESLSENQNTKEEMPLKLKLGNLGRHVTKKDVVKILSQQQLLYKNVKVAHKWTHAIIQFETLEQLDSCKAKLEQFEYKGNLTTLSVVKEQVRQIEPKEFVDDGRTPSERIQDQVTPLWRLAYPDQLEQKQEWVTKVSTRLAKELFKYFPKKNYRGSVPPVDPSVDPLERIKGMTCEQRALEQLDWIKGATKQYDGVPCPIQPIMPSPIINEYRTKCEFTFGKDLQDQKTCGFLLGLYKHGQTAVLPPQDCLHVSKSAKMIAGVLQEFVNQSAMSVYDRTTQQGFYRLSLVRTLQSGQTMVMVQVNPTDVDPAILEQEKTALKEWMVERTNVTSLYWQESNEKFNGIKEDMPMTLIHGTPQVVEKLMGLEFEISPTSFFQVNPSATEVLYGKIRDLSLEAVEKAKEELKTGAVNVTEETIQQAVVEESSKDEETTADENAKDEVTAVEAEKKEPGVVLLDLCSGTGTIGISMAKHVKKVIGVELCPEAVEDAKRNTKLNGLDNVFSLQGKVEEKMHGIFKYHLDPQDTVIAVLDPPRSGVHYSVIKSIRDCAALNHIVFVACDFNNSLQNIVDLCRPTSNKYKGHPFVPKQIIPVDMFPHTQHCEVIVELVRQEATNVVVQNGEGDEAVVNSTEQEANQHTSDQGAAKEKVQ